MQKNAEKSHIAGMSQSSMEIRDSFDTFDARTLCTYASVRNVDW